MGYVPTTNPNPSKGKPNVKIPSNQWFNLIGHNGLCVDAARNGHRLRQGRCSTGSNSQWSFIPHNNGYIIRNKNNIAVDNSGSRNKDRNPIIGYKNHRGHNQIWVPEMVNGNTIRMKTQQLTNVWKLKEDYSILIPAKNQIPIKCLILDILIMHQLLLLLNPLFLQLLQPNQLLLLINHIFHLYMYPLLTLTLVKENQMLKFLQINGLI